MRKKKSSFSYSRFLCCNQGLLLVEYYNSLRDFLHQVTLRVSLNLEVREATSLDIFKKNITKSIPQTPKYFYLVNALLTFCIPNRDLTVFEL